mmetsp:Transcript_48135/g.65558  ORF Transcript_48135/g.65558 Transcript_48135/m.65558 type:complete len:123 (-) Transcript_48135:706-1074(-)
MKESYHSRERSELYRTIQLSGLYHMVIVTQFHRGTKAISALIQNAVVGFEGPVQRTPFRQNGMGASECDDPHEHENHAPHHPGKNYREKNEKKGGCSQDVAEKEPDHRCQEGEDSGPPPRTH